MSLSSLKLNALVTLFNSAVIDYAPEGFAEVTGFKSKAIAAERIEALCAAGSLAVEFDGDSAVIVDAMEAADDAAAPEGWDMVEGGPEGTSLADTGTALVIYTGATADSAEGDDADDSEGDDDAVTLGDGKGIIAPSGFKRASDDWLKANERGTAEREAYRKARRKAARETRKAARDMKEAALNEAIAG